MFNKTLSISRVCWSF